MGVLIRKDGGLVIFTGIAKLATVGLIVALASSLIDTIWAVYIDGFVNNMALVGFLSGFLTFIAFISYFLFVPLIQKSNKTKIFAYSLPLFAITYILFAINTSFYIFILLAFILTVLGTLRITSFGIVVKDKSSEKKLSRNEGLMYTFMNISWVIGPLIAGFIAEMYGINRVFILAAIFVLIAFFLFRISKVRDANIKKRIDRKIIKNFFAYFKNKKRVAAYIIGGGVHLWWILIYLFMPLFMIRNGLNKLWIGYFLFAVAVPLIITQYRFAQIAEKAGFRKIFIIGFLIPAILVLLCFFVSNIYLILALLILASFGLSMLEPTTEAYFFDILRGEQDCRFYGPYNTNREVSQFVGKVFPAILLIFLPFKFIFLLYGLFMLIAFLVSLKIKNIVESRRDGRKNM